MYVYRTSQQSMCSFDEHQALLKLKDIPQPKNKEIHIWFSLFLLPILSYLTIKFAYIFPNILWSKSHLYYIPANWLYDETNTVFCDSVWTWGTDYILATFMALGAYRLYFRSYTTSRSREVLSGVPTTASILMILYTLSVLSGGYAHQHYHTVKSLNTQSFKITWFICVGTVAMAGGPIGAIGSNLAKSFNKMNAESYFHVPILPNVFWVGWSILFTAWCYNGDMSYKRPPCDIFIAGTTQALPSFYSILVLLSFKWKSNKNDLILKSFLEKVTPMHRFLYMLCWVLNAPLLPVYPHLLHVGLPEHVINTMLHCNLFVAWSLQSYTTRRFCLIIDEVLKEGSGNKLD